MHVASVSAGRAKPSHAVGWRSLMNAHTPSILAVYIIVGLRRKHAVLGQRHSRFLLCRVPVAHTHISTLGIYSSHGLRENVGTGTQTERPTDRLQ